METPGVGFPIPPLISSCQKIVRTLHDVAKKFKRAPLMMTSIASECGLIHVALTQLRDFDWSGLNPDSKNQLEQMIRATETIILGCTLTLSVIEEYAMELHEYVQGSKLSPTEQMGVMSRVRVFWKEDEMRELLVQLRGYQSGLTDLLRAANDDSFSEEQDMTNVLNNFVSLLNRSRNSRSKKPLSIRSAMQQSVAYTNLARSTIATSPTISQHVIPPRKSSGTASVPPVPLTRSIESELVRGMSPMTADLYDGATSATANRKAVTDKSRKKRPAFLALDNNEDADTNSEQARYVQSRKDREHLRKSSPTVGENFTFLETTSDVGDRPMPEHPRHTRTPSLPRNGARSSRSRQELSTPVEEVKDISTNIYDCGEDTEDDDLEEDLDGPPPPPSQVVTPGIEKLDPIREEIVSQPRPKKSTSSVRSQIIGLPEQARLRKQASGELARQQREQEETPLLPAIKMYHAPNRVSSQEALKRRRQSDTTHKHQASDPTNLAFRPRKTSSRSASQDARANAADSRPQPTGPLPGVPYDQQYGHGPRSSAMPSSPSREHSPTTGRAMSLTPQPGVHAVENESWPFTAEMAQQNHQAFLNSPSTVHSRNVSEARSYSSMRALSPDATPRASRSATPLMTGAAHNITPNRGRSRSNTGPTLTEDIEPSHLDDSSSISHSVAPSTMSAQWYRTPQERLGLGSKLHRTNAPPNWEQMSREEPFDDEQKRRDDDNSNTRKVQLFSIYPPKEGLLAKDQGGPDHPPRSPLLTDKFLTDVGGLPPDRPSEPPARTLSLNRLAPRRMLSSRQGKREEEESSESPSKKKKDSRFPSFGELVTEYKSLANKWYTSADDVEAISERPSTSTTNLRSHTINEEAPYQHQNGTNPSLRNKPSREAESIDSRSSKSAAAKSAKSAKSEKKKKKKPSLFSEMRSEYKSLSNNWYQEAVAEDAEAQRVANGGAPSTRRSSRSGRDY